MGDSLLFFPPQNNHSMNIILHIQNVTIYCFFANNPVEISKFGNHYQERKMLIKKIID